MTSVFRKFASLLLAVTSLTALTFTASEVQAAARAYSDLRSRELWGNKIDYQFILQNDSSARVDGEAFVKNVKGQKVNVVILNKAFFKKEAEELFHRLEKSISSEPPSPEKLLGLEKDLLALRNSTNAVPAMDSALVQALKELQKNLEAMAWKGLYQEATANASGRKDMEARFVESFTQARLQTIEIHELAHLVDLQETGNTEGADFQKFTELNAFYSELAFGSHPQDVMAQAIAGMIDEMKQGKRVDHSIAKVASVVEFLKSCPKMRKDFQRGPLPSCCLAALTKIQNSDFVMAGRTLYQKSQKTKGLLLANLL